MKILLLAPQPFFQERGTPIAVNLLLRALSAAGHALDVVTLREGENVSYPGVTLHRVGPRAWFRGVRPGFSARKMLADWFVFTKAMKLARTGRYDVVHAVEEAIFAAWLPWLRKLPFVYDMDSCLSRQIGESHPHLRWLRPVLERCEKAAVRRAAAVLAVCEALAATARHHGAGQVTVLRDISLLENCGQPADVNLRGATPPGAFLFLYIGNLEPYQGIDLLLASFALVNKTAPGSVALAIVGGTPATIAAYRRKAAALGITANTTFLGPKPVAMLKGLLDQADAVVSPRVQGNNTPMKIYSYLDAGKPIVATAISSHTEVLDEAVAVLAPPEPAAFADAMRRVTADPDLRRRIAANARALAARRYHFAAYQETVWQFYRDLEQRLKARRLSATT